MTLQERKKLAARLRKAADYAIKEWLFLHDVAQLSMQNLSEAAQRYRILSDASVDVYDFDFDKGE